MELKEIKVVSKTTINNHVHAWVKITYVERGVDCAEMVEAFDDQTSFFSNKRWAKKACDDLVAEKKLANLNCTLTVSKAYADYVDF